MKSKLLLTLVLLVTIIFSVNAQQGDGVKTNRRDKTRPKKTVLEVPLPPRSADCFFAAPLQIDVPFGPTEPPRGFGFVNEIQRDNKVQNVFEEEHNTVWYTVDIPYDGKLCIDITPKAASDDYDFLVYKYTNKYFCNRIIGNKVRPIRSVLSTNNTEIGGKTGLNLKSELENISKKSSSAYGKYIDVKANQKYVIVVDNFSSGGLGHTIYVTINTNYAPLHVLPIDSSNHQRTTANILVKDKRTENIILERENVGAQRIKVLPNKAYSISLKKEGYFNYLREITHAQALKDSILTARLVRIKPGSYLPIMGDLYFDMDELKNVILLSESYHSLDEVLKTLQNYPEIIVEIIGRIPTEGYNLRKDAETSLLRAEAIKNYLIGRGIPEANLKARGSYIKELREQLADQKKSRSGVLLNPQSQIRILKTN